MKNGDTIITTSGLIGTYLGALSKRMSLIGFGADAKPCEWFTSKFRLATAEEVLTAHRVSSREDRVRACELAAQCMQGQGTDGDIGARLMSLVVFFETYIGHGADATEKQMRMLTHAVRGNARKNWRVVAGGAMGSKR